ncbi:MAG: hypothetical protein ABIY90_19610 [Puia sp.]
MSILRAFFCSMAFWLAVSTPALCQQYIYFQTGSKQGKVLDITAKTLTYKNANADLSSLTIPTHDVLLLFNENGDFLVPSKMDFSQPQIQQEIKQFLNPGANNRVSDHIYLNSKNRIEGNIVKENDQFVYLAADKTTNKIDRKSILAILYKDGHPALFGPVEKIAACLWSDRDSTATLLIVGAEDTSSVKEVTMDIPTASPSQTGNNVKTISVDSIRPLTFEEVAGKVSKEEFEKKALQKTNQLNVYLKILCDKTATYEEINKTIDQAVTLFVDENAMIETSSISRNDVRRYKIRTYLSRLKLVQYDKIEIEWTNVQYVSDVKRGVDGNFYGVVSFEQVFRGYRDGKLVYQDITRKNATIVLKTYEKNYEGNVTNVWDVLLSDIGVITTKSI